MDDVVVTRRQCRVPALGLRYQHFCVVTNLDAHRYELCLELRPDSPPGPGAGATAPGGPPTDLPARLDEALSSAIAYRIFREQGLIVAPVVHLMAEGWQEALYRAQIGPGRSRSQVKLKVVELAVSEPASVLRTLG